MSIKAVCQYCGKTFYYESNQTRKYCKSGCRVMACRKRKRKQVKFYFQDEVYILK
jgi:hypothetical protein